MWPDGSRYEGTWKDSKRHGTGAMCWPDGTSWHGEWNEDVRVSEEELPPRPWDCFFRQSIEEMRQHVQEYMLYFRKSRQKHDPCQ
jgi:hypothetical protein